MKFRKFLFFLTVSLSLCLTGCSLSEDNAYLGSALSESKREDALEASLSELEGVERVSVSLWGKTALIGFLPEEDANADELSNIITAKALETDKGISYVSVSRNPEIMKRIEKL